MQEDDLNAARGVACGIAMAVMVWCVLMGVWCCGSDRRVAMGKKRKTRSRLVATQLFVSSCESTFESRQVQHAPVNRQARSQAKIANPCVWFVATIAHAQSQLFHQSPNGAKLRYGIRFVGCNERQIARLGDWMRFIAEEAAGAWRFLDMCFTIGGQRALFRW